MSWLQVLVYNEHALHDAGFYHSLDFCDFSVGHDGDEFVVELSAVLDDDSSLHFFQIPYVSLVQAVAAAQAKIEQVKLLGLESLDEIRVAAVGTHQPLGGDK